MRKAQVKATALSSKSVLTRNVVPAPARPRLVKSTAKPAQVSAARAEPARSSSKPAAKPVLVKPASAPKPAPEPERIDPRYEQYYEVLMDKRRELIGNLEEVKFDTLARLGRVAEEDQAQISHEEFISLQRNSMDYQALRLVDGALDRIRSGEYGVCQECEEEISAKRLAAIPWAKFCVHCQDHAAQSAHVDEYDEAVNDY
ncbi:MAG: TraR/DksA C4-type zinc finger protein [Bryobacteraceae bacterium]